MFCKIRTDEKSHGFLTVILFNKVVWKKPSLTDHTILPKTLLLSFVSMEWQFS